MAIGDDAIAAGIDLVPGTGQASDLDLYINKLADEVARRTMATLSLARGGTGATTAPAARSNLGIPVISSPGVATENGVAVFGPNKRLQVQDPEQPSDATTRYWVDNTIAYHRGQLQADIDSVRNLANGKRNTDDGSFPGDVTAKNLYARESFAATSGWTVAYINSDGRLSKGASSERYKKYISDIDAEDLGDIFPQLVRYQMRSQQGSRTDNAWHVGHIAERLAEHPDQEPFVVYAEHDGETVPDSIDFIALLLAQTSQLHRELGVASEVIAGLVSRIEALEGKSNA